MNTAVNIACPIIGQKMPERTPFVPQKDGTFVLILQVGYTLEWGHRFDSYLGYRVFIKFKECAVINAMPPSMARKWAVNIRKDEQMIDMLTLSRVLIELADQVEKLNNAWAAAGCPDEPLHEVMEGKEGHA